MLSGGPNWRKSDREKWPSGQRWPPLDEGAVTLTKGIDAFDSFQSDLFGVTEWEKNLSHIEVDRTLSGEEADLIERATGRGCKVLQGPTTHSEKRVGIPPGYVTGSCLFVQRLC